MRLRLTHVLIGASVGALAACGGSGARPGTPGAASGDAGAAAVHAGPRPAGALPFSTATVPMASMPGPFQFGSRKAEKRTIAGLSACHATFRTSSSDLVGEVQKLAKACADPSKTRPALAPWSGSQTQGTAAQSFKFKAEAGRCYRVYAAAAPTVANLSVLVIDSSGAVAWESRSEEQRIALPDDGVLCFKAADDAVISVSVGAGEGAYAVQLWAQ